MRKNFIIAIIMMAYILIPTKTLAHKEQVHQYIVIQAYHLLENKYPGISMTAMASHIGFQDGPEATCAGIGISWSDGLMTRGAFREDCQDMVYHNYGQFSEDVTMNHFWDADQGDEFELHFAMPTADFENAYQKVRRYVHGHYNLWMETNLFYPPNKAAGPGVLYLSYNSLVDLYKNHRIYLVGFFRSGEGVYNYDTPILVTNDILTGTGRTVQELTETIAWETLGRMAHLLGDMTVPAHTHNDLHPGLLGGIVDGGADTYERWEWEGSHYQEVTWDSVQQQGPLDVYSAVHSSDYDREMRYLFYTTNQVADRFPSNDADGDNNYALSYLDDDYSVLNIISEISTSSSSQDMPKAGGLFGVWGELYNPWGRAMNQYAFRFGIRAVAGLMYWFAVETGQLNREICGTNFNGGVVKINGENKPSGSAIVLPVGEHFNLDVSDQSWPDDQGVNTARIFSKWEKTSSQSSEFHEQHEWQGIPVTESARFTALMANLYNINLESPISLDGSVGSYTVNGISGLSSWTGGFVQSASPAIQIEADPGVGSSFMSWSDGNFDNPRQLIPVTHTTLYAIFKKPFYSMSEVALGGNSSKVGARDNSGVMYIDYESANGIYSTESSNNGTSWDRELLFGLPNNVTQYHNPNLFLDSLGESAHTIYEKIEFNQQTNSWLHRIMWNGAPIVVMDLPFETQSLDELGEFSTTSDTYRAKPVATMTSAGPSNAILSAAWCVNGDIKFGIGVAPFIDHTPPELGGHQLWSTVFLGTKYPMLVPQNVCIVSKCDVAHDQVGQAPNSSIGYHFYVLWEEPGQSGGIKLIVGTIPSSGIFWPVQNADISWSATPTMVASNTITETNSQPTMALDQVGNLSIAWVSINGSSRTIKVQRWGPGLSTNLGTSIVGQSSPTTGIICSPSITTHPGVEGDQGIGVVWSTSSKKSFGAHFDGTQWSPQYILSSDNVQQVSLSDSKSNTTDRSLLVLSGASAPYHIASVPFPSPVSTSDALVTGWNLKSIAVGAYEYPATLAFPNASSSIFAYTNTYIPTDPVSSGAGYWIKYDGDETINQFGAPLVNQTIPVNSGWNMVGSNSAEIDINQISSDPPGIIVSDFFGYRDGGYAQSDTVYHGQGYWVRTSQAGKLFYGQSGDRGQNQYSSLPAAPGTPPAVPILLSPTDSILDMPQTLTLVWMDTNAVTQYQLQVSHSSDFSSLDVNNTGLTVSTKQIGPLAPGARYYWRVKAFNSDGSRGWSVVRSFSIPNPTTAPNLASPSNGATAQPTIPILTWNPSTDATSYHLQLSTDGGFTALQVNDSILTNTQRQALGLASATTYYWRVAAKNGVGKSAWSNVWSFTTAMLPPTPVLASPVNGATNQSNTPVLSWNASTDASVYRLQISDNSSFTTITFDYSEVVTTSMNVGPLSGNKTYYWRVNASNMIGTSAWSNGWAFTTLAPPLPSTVTLVYPNNGLTDVPPSTTLQWGSASNAEKYQVQVSTLSSFSVKIIDDSLLTTLTKSVTLSNSATYYWRVRAKNSTGSGPWSSTWHFTTQADACQPNPDLASVATPLDQVVVSDAHGNRQSLFINNERHGVGSGPRDDQMPPETPNDLFDVRFKSGRIREHVPTNDTAFDLPLKMKGVSYPIVFKWNFHGQNNMLYKLKLKGHRNKNISEGVIPLTDSGSIILENKGDGGSLILQSQAINPCPSPERMVKSSASEEADNSLPHSYELKQNVPNPFNPTTQIQYSLPEPSQVSLSVYNLLGQEVRQLVNEYQSAGVKYIEFNASSLPSGVYFYRIQAGTFNKILKMVLLK